MNKQPEFYWDEDNGVCNCAIEDSKGRVFIGLATCNDEDKDFQSERTGQEISYRRARIELLRANRDEIKTQLAAYKQFYYSMKHSSHYNDKSYEAKMLKRFIYRLSMDLETAKEIINDESAALRQYLDLKDKAFAALRAKRDK